MGKSIQSAPWIAKDAPSWRESKIHQERSGIAGNFSRNSRVYRTIWPRKCLQHGRVWLVFSNASEIASLCPTRTSQPPRAKRKSKNRVSLIICVNASGSHKTPYALIRKLEEPACIKDRYWPIPYFNQAKAWMDVETFSKWFNEVFYPRSEKTNRTSHSIVDGQCSRTF